MTHLKLNGTSQALARVVPCHLSSCYMTVCAASDAPKYEVEKIANDHAPTGLEHGWEIHTGRFSDGQPNPCPCENHRDRKHWLLSC